MARDESLPFDRGQTFYNGGTIDATSDTTLGGVNIEGSEYVVQDSIYGTGHPIRLRVVRNAGLTNILPTQLCTFNGVAAGYYGRRVTGPTQVTDDYCYPADELLPAAGVPPGDLFFIVVRGPALCTSTSTLVPTIAIGDNLFSCTAAASTSADAGKIIDQSQVIAASVTTDVTLVENRIGRAMSALTSAQTATSVLVGIRW